MPLSQLNKPLVVVLAYLTYIAVKRKIPHQPVRPDVIPVRVPADQNLCRCIYLCFHFAKTASSEVLDSALTSFATISVITDMASAVGSPPGMSQLISRDTHIGVLGHPTELRVHHPVSNRDTD